MKHQESKTVAKGLNWLKIKIGAILILEYPAFLFLTLLIKTVGIKTGLFAEIIMLLAVFAGGTVLAQKTVKDYLSLSDDGAQKQLQKHFSEFK